MDVMQQSVLALTGETAKAKESANLLSSLREQRAHLAEAQEVIRNLQLMEEALRNQRQEVLMAHVALGEVILLKDKLVGQHRHTVFADEAVDRLQHIAQVLSQGHRDTLNAEMELCELQSLRSRLLKSVDKTPVAAEVLSQMELVTDDLVANAEQVERAGVVQEQATALRNQLIGTDGLTEQAARSLANIDSLRSQLIDAQDNNFVAQETADELIQMKETLEYNRPGILAAHNALEQMVDLKERTIITGLQAEQSHDALRSIEATCVQITSLEAGAKDAARAVKEIDFWQKQIADLKWPALAAQASAEKLIELKNTLLREGFDVPRAIQGLQQLASLKDQVIQSSQEIEAVVTATPLPVEPASICTPPTEFENPFIPSIDAEGEWELQSLDEESYFQDANHIGEPAAFLQVQSNGGCCGFSRLSNELGKFVWETSLLGQAVPQVGTLSATLEQLIDQQ